MTAGVAIRHAVVVITGASSGIGRATALRLAHKGANLVLAARGSQALDEALRECRDLGASALAVSADVASGDDMERLAQSTHRAFGRIDVWINNAAVMAYGEIATVPEKVQRRIIDVNLVGQMNGARAVLPYMERQGRGVLINVASLYAKMTSPYVSAYATSKFGVVGFSEVLRQEMERHRGIAVCTILPGSIDTPIFRHSANYTGYRVKPPPPVSAPSRVVRAIVKAIRRPEREVVVGRAQQVGSWMHTLLPRLYGKAVPYAMSTLAMGEEASPDSEGNVFHPLPEYSGIEGDWRRGRHRAALTIASVGAAVAFGAWWSVRKR